MSDKLNNIFDQGFSGILDESTRKDQKLPEYLDKLAETEKNTKEEEVKTADLTFEKDVGLTRAVELNNGLVSQDAAI